MTQSPRFPPDTLSASAERALPLLESLDPNQTDLVHAWIEHGNAAAVQEVAERGAGAARKAARRGLNVLRSRGIKPLPATPAKTKNAEIAKSTAYLLSPDSAGVCIIGLSKTSSGGRHQSCTVYLSQHQGVYRVETSNLSAPKLNAALSKVMSKAGYKPVEVPVDWARHRVAEARAHHAKTSRPEPMGFMAAAPLLEPLPAESPQHPFSAEGLAVSLDDAKALANDSGALHHLPEFRTWLPSESAVNELLKQVGTHIAPDQQPDNDAVGELLKQEMLAATDRFFSPEIRQTLADRMRDAGLSVLARDGESAALKIAATIEVIERCGLVTDPPRDVPFLRAFFEKAISFLMARSGGKLDIPVPRRSASPETAG